VSATRELPRTLLADDHLLVAEGLNRLLEEHCNVVATVANGNDLVTAAIDLQPDVIIADLSMPGLSGLEATALLRARGLTSKIVILTMYSDARIAKEAFKAGAVGFVSKQAAGQELVAAIEQVLSGGVYVSRPVAEQMGSLTAPEQAAVTLTARQRQVLQFIAKGYRMREIASALRLSRRTVEAHKYEIMRLLGFRNTADLVRYATWLGLIET
jgi:DNA-binding NarL/FixJ family response regulator